MSRGAWTRKLAVVEEEERLPSPQRIGVLSDTHLTPTRQRRGIDAAVDFFRRAKVTSVMHAGDVGDPGLLEELAALAPVYAVRGNADPRELLETLPDRIRFGVGERTILLLHGHHGKTARATAASAVAPDIDLIIFGHSHKPLIERQGRTILFNPGSVVERRWNPHFGVGLIDVADAGVAPDLVLFDDPAQLAQISP